MRSVRPGWVRTKRGLVKLNRRAEAIISHNAWRAIGESARTDVAMNALTGGMAVEKFIADRQADMCKALIDIRNDIQKFLQKDDDVAAR